MLGALASFTTMAIAARELTLGMSVVQALFFRSLICVIVLMPFAVIGGGGPFRKIATQRPKLHLARNTIHYFGQLGWVYALSLLPLAAVFSIEFTVPIWTAILAAIFLGEGFTRWRVIGVVMGFIGILVIVRPGPEMLEAAEASLATLAMVGAAVLYAATFVFTRHMAQTESPLAIIFWMNLIQLGIGIIPALLLWVDPEPESLPWIVLIGLGGLCSHWCVAHAMRHADAAVVAPMDFIRLPLIAVIGYVFYNEPWNPFILIGGVIIFAGNMVNLWGERRR
jgi:drug/metabolite transporter (DMT)-like permease